MCYPIIPATCLRDAPASGSSSPVRSLQACLLLEIDHAFHSGLSSPVGPASLKLVRSDATFGSPNLQPVSGPIISSLLFRSQPVLEIAQGAACVVAEKGKALRDADLLARSPLSHRSRLVLSMIALLCKLGQVWFRRLAHLLSIR